MLDASSEAALAELTPRQRAVLDVVQQYTAEHGYPPTVREIQGVLGVASTSTVHAHLATLERVGLIQRDPTKPRAISWEASRGRPAPDHGGVEATDVDVEHAQVMPVLGRVAAGAPILADQHVEQYLPVPKLLTRAGESFLLKVRGDSMVEAGILDGDYVVVRRQPQAANGEIVIALVDGDEATCKRFFRRGDHIELRPENSAMEPIKVSGDQCEIVGIVTGMLRAL